MKRKYYSSQHGNPEDHKEIFSKCIYSTRHWWLIPIILTTWEAEIRRITVQGQPRKKASEIPS
jgi:hypothetical protein